MYCKFENIFKIFKFLNFISNCIVFFIFQNPLFLQHFSLPRMQEKKTCDCH